MIWQLSWRADPAARPLADAHYTRQKIGSRQFVPPGRCLVLVTPCRRAYWVTSWPYPEYVKHAWPGAWVCSAFRNDEGAAGLSSDLIRQAVAATVWWKGHNPLGMVTFVDPTKVRHKRDPGRCFARAGFRLLAERTKEEGHLVFRLDAENLPQPSAPVGAQLSLEADREHETECA